MVTLGKYSPIMCLRERNWRDQARQLTPVIPATQEVMMEGSPIEAAQAKVSKTLLKNRLGLVANTCNPSYTGGRSRGIEV
jgi:hypothetical protein